MADLDDHWLAAVVPFLPAPLLLQRIDDLARHVALVVLGENGLGADLAGRVQHALGDDALTLAEQVRQEALIGDLEIMRAVGDDEGDVLVRRI